MSREFTWMAWTWPWPWGEYLHHRNQQTINQGLFVFSWRTSGLTFIAHHRIQGTKLMSQAFYQLSPPKFLPLSPVSLLLPGDCRQSKHHCYKRYKYHLEQNLLPPRFLPTPTPTPQMSLFSPLLVKLQFTESLSDPCPTHAFTC